MPYELPGPPSAARERNGENTHADYATCRELCNLSPLRGPGADDILARLGGRERMIREGTRRSFTLALLLGTWLPMAFFLTVGSMPGPGAGDGIKAALLAIGGVHVAATLILYVD